ncbi:MAG: hypothetical protein R2880_09565 [Deinococcales bacterium]
MPLSHINISGYEEEPLPTAYPQHLFLAYLHSTSNYLDREIFHGVIVRAANKQAVTDQLNGHHWRVGPIKEVSCASMEEAFKELHADLSRKLFERYPHRQDLKPFWVKAKSTLFSSQTSCYFLIYAKNYTAAGKWASSKRWHVSHIEDLPNILPETKAAAFNLLAMLKLVFGRKKGK